MVGEHRGPLARMVNSAAASATAAAIGKLREELDDLTEKFPDLAEAMQALGYEKVWFYSLDAAVRNLSTERGAAHDVLVEDFSVGTGAKKGE